MSKDVVVKQSLIDTATGEVVKQKSFMLKIILMQKRDIILHHKKIVSAFFPAICMKN